MRIISDFSDYYDCVQAYGQDKNCVYNRITKSVYRNKQYTHSYSDYYYTKNQDVTHYIDFGYIGFCGNYYNYVRVYDRKSLNIYFYNYDEYLDFRMVHDIHFSKNQKKKWYKKSTANERYNFQRPKQSSHDEFFKYNTPILVHKKNSLLINPILKDMQFFKVKDVYSAYNDIYCYLNGVLGTNQKPIPVPDDVTMAEIKGFNKYSFRKDPQK